MNRQIKIIQVDNGYILAFLDYSGTQKVFKSFTDLMDYLFGYFQERHKEADYRPYELYEKLGLEKPKKETQVTEVTHKTCGSKLLNGFLENEPHSGTVTSVTSVTETSETSETEKQREEG